VKRRLPLGKDQVTINDIEIPGLQYRGID